MRKLLLTCALIALAAPVVAVAAKRSPGDGTLQVRNGSGDIAIVARGGLIGRCGRCVVTIADPVPGDGTGPIVFGADSDRVLSETRTRYVNKDPREDMRFRIIGGRYVVVVKGSDINLSVVGTGIVFIQGAPGVDGEYSFDGEPFQSLPDTRTKFQLGLPLNAGG